MKFDRQKYSLFFSFFLIGCNESSRFKKKKKLVVEITQSKIGNNNGRKNYPIVEKLVPDFKSKKKKFQLNFFFYFYFFSNLNKFKKNIF